MDIGSKVIQEKARCTLPSRPDYLPSDVKVYMLTKAGERKVLPNPERAELGKLEEGRDLRLVKVIPYVPGNEDYGAPKSRQTTPYQPTDAIGNHTQPENQNI